jgi:hypothetical protein
MAQHTPVEDQVIDIVHRAHACDFEEHAAMPNLTGNQVFLAVDHLSRNGELMLMPRGRGTYTVTSPTCRKVGLIDAHSHLNHKEVILCLL